MYARGMSVRKIVGHVRELWGSAMTHHLHIHMVVPGGGLSPDVARWIACRRGFLLPVKVLGRLFRRLWDCRGFRVGAGIVGWKETPHASTQTACDRRLAA